jgi:hypothetical protein
MSVETSSMFERVIQDHLALKERNARLDGKMPIEGYKETDPLENHPLFKTEEQARVEETMDGIDPDFSDETLEDVGLGMWPEQPQAQATVANTWSAESTTATEDATSENAAPLPSPPRSPASGIPAAPATSTGATKRSRS